MLFPLEKELTGLFGKTEMSIDGQHRDIGLVNPSGDPANSVIQASEDGPTFQFRGDALPATRLFHHSQTGACGFVFLESETAQSDPFFLRGGEKLGGGVIPIGTGINPFTKFIIALKTALVSRIVQNSFSDQGVQTLTASFVIRNFHESEKTDSWQSAGG